jgi:hypothetical protein
MLCESAAGQDRWRERVALLDVIALPQPGSPAPPGIDRETWQTEKAAITAGRRDMAHSSHESFVFALSAARL